MRSRMSWNHPPTPHWAGWCISFGLIQLRNHNWSTQRQHRPSSSITSVDSHRIIGQNQWQLPAGHLKWEWLAECGLSLNENASWLLLSSSGTLVSSRMCPFPFLMNTQQLLVDHCKVLLIAFCNPNDQCLCRCHLKMGHSSESHDFIFSQPFNKPLRSCAVRGEAWQKVTAHNPKHWAVLYILWTRNTACRIYHFRRRGKNWEK